MNRRPIAIDVLSGVLIGASLLVGGCATSAPTPPGARSEPAPRMARVPVETARPSERQGIAQRRHGDQSLFLVNVPERPPTPKTPAGTGRPPVTRVPASAGSPVPPVELLAPRHAPARD